MTIAFIASDFDASELDVQLLEQPSAEPLTGKITTRAGSISRALMKRSPPVPGSVSPGHLDGSSWIAGR